MRNLTREDFEQLDRAAVTDLLQRERTARDGYAWDEMASCYHPDSRIEVSWFQGSGASFTEASRNNAARGRFSLHHIGACVVTVKDDRAAADMGCQVLGFNTLDGADVCVVSHARLIWRAQRLDGRWLIAGLRMIYLRDAMQACNPSRVPVLDEAELSRYRTSYRYLSYLLARSPNPPDSDLPGIDRPETVAILREGEAKWLQGG